MHKLSNPVEEQTATRLSSWVIGCTNVQLWSCDEFYLCFVFCTRVKAEHADVLTDMYGSERNGRETGDTRAPDQSGTHKWRNAILSLLSNFCSEGAFMKHSSPSRTSMLLFQWHIFSTSSNCPVSWPLFLPFPVLVHTAAAQDSYMESTLGGCHRWVDACQTAKPAAHMEAVHICFWRLFVCSRGSVSSLDQIESCT